MAFVKNFTAGSITLTDGTPTTPLTITLDLDQGDLSFGPLRAVLNEYTKYERRGRFVSAAHGARIYPTGSFSCMVAQFSDGTAKVISDFILGDGAFAARKSTLAGGGPFACDLTFTMEGTDFGDSADHTVTFEDAVISIDSFSEGDPNTISCSFEVLGAVTGDLVADEM